MCTESFSRQSDGYLMGQSNSRKGLLYYDTHTHQAKIIHHAYVDKHYIIIHPKEHLTTGSLLINDYPLGHYTSDIPDLSDIKVEKYQPDITNSPFNPKQVLGIDYELPPSEKSQHLNNVK